LQDVPRIARTIGTQQVRSGSQHFAALADAAEVFLSLFMSTSALFIGALEAVYQRHPEI
jgi:hypothetical protein